MNFLLLDGNKLLKVREPRCHAFGRGPMTIFRRWRILRHSAAREQRRCRIGNEKRRRCDSAKRDPSGSIYLWKDRRTVVEFTIDRQGELKDVHVTMSSGVEYLDHVALDAFRRAERFPNPPPGLFSPDGTVTMGFGFVLGLARGFRTRLGPAYLPNSPAQRGY